MKRFHVHIGVKDLEKSVAFYSKLFGQAPTKFKPDYAKWQLDDPRINFAISTKVSKKGLDHLGIQVDEKHELEALTSRLENAEISLFDQGEAECCYAKSNKAWVQDPSGIAWEAFHTMADVEIFSKAKEASACCLEPKLKNESSTKSKCC